MTQLHTTGLHTEYFDQVDIPEQKIGDYSIVHNTKPAGTTLSRVSPRTMIHAGHEACPVHFTYATRWHSLRRDGGTLMTDLPIEQYQCDEHIKDMEGDVLVGGLGLGYCVNRLARNPKVTSVTVIEISPEVIEMVEPHIRDRRNIVQVVQADLKEWLAVVGRPTFDWAFYDTWSSDGEGTFHRDVMPLRKLSVGLVENDHVVCWNEDVMHGQLINNLTGTYMFATSVDATMRKTMPTFDDLCEPRDPVYCDWAIGFWKRVRDGEIEAENLHEEAAKYVHGMSARPFEH